MKEWFVIALGGCAIIACPLAWVSHLYVCFTAELWGFLIAGAIFFPVGIIHGFGIWFGWW